MTYRLADVDAAEKRLKCECAGVVTERNDYNWSLTAIKPDRSGAIIVFRLPIDEIGQTEVVADIDKVIALLKS